MGLKVYVPCGRCLIIAWGGQRMKSNITNTDYSGIKDFFLGKGYE